MPSEFAHKKFGALVYKKLPDDIKRIIAENKNEYLIALHGPDPYYFCLPSDHDRMVPVAERHHQRPFAYMQKRAFSVIKNISDGPELSYYYGMICHFVLDSFCHPLVDKAIAETGLSHGKIEMEFERYLLDLDGKKALAYPSYAHLPIDKNTAVTAARFYEDSSAEDFYKCMILMKSMLFLCIGKTGFYRHGVAKIMDMAGYGGNVASLIKSKDPSRICRKQMTELFTCMMDSVDTAVAEITDFTAMIMSGDRRLSRFANRDFSGNIW